MVLTQCIIQCIYNNFAICYCEFLSILVWYKVKNTREINKKLFKVAAILYFQLIFYEFQLGSIRAQSTKTNFMFLS